MRHTLLTLALAAIAGSIPGAAHAQIRITPQSFGGRTSPVVLYGNSGQPISAAECVANVGIPLEITGLPATGGVLTVLDIWRGPSGSGNCNQATNRQTMTGSTPICTHIQSVAITSTIQSLSLPAETAFGAAACTSSVSTPYDFYFLAVATAQDNSTEVSTTNAGSVTVAIDPVAPGAPVLMESAGDTVITVGWSNPDATEALYGAHVYVDLSGCDATGTPVTGGPLMAGGTAPTSVTPSTFQGQTIESATLDPAALGLAYGDFAAVGVTILDRARNESVLSNVVCIERVQVQGFWDAYCAERGMADVEACRANYSCSIEAGGGSASACGWAVGLAALAAVARRRMRRAR